MIEDTELLRRYAEEHSEAAFTELVERRLGLVYAVALRQTRGDAHRAQDIAQTVFTNLARKASSLSRQPVLAGWLYRSAQFAASDAMRTEWRRQVREQAAHTMNEILSEDRSAGDWDKLRPDLDQVMSELDESDRDALVLRFFDDRPFADVGAKLNLTENAARMRVQRALEKVRALLARRGVTSTTAALAGVLTGQAGTAAPAAIVASVSSAALAGAASGGALVTAAGLFKIMSTTKIITAAGVVALVGLAGYEFAIIQKTKESAASLDRERVQMARDIAALKREIEAAKASRAAPSTRSAVGVTSSKSSDQREQGSTAAPDTTAANSAYPQKPASRLVPDEVRALTVASAMKAAMDGYHAAHSGQEPPNLQALIPYFATPQEGADYVEYLEAQKEAAQKEARQN
jgi:RNA polymerase sigma factor (sigma-70 family)